MNQQYHQLTPHPGIALIPLPLAVLLGFTPGLSSVASAIICLTIEQIFDEPRVRWL